MNDEIEKWRILYSSASVHECVVSLHAGAGIENDWLKCGMKMLDVKSFEFFGRFSS